MRQVSAGEESGDEPPVATGFAELLYDVAAVSSGYELQDPAAFAKRVVALMSDGEEALADLVSGMSSGPTPVAADSLPAEGDEDSNHSCSFDPGERVGKMVLCNISMYLFSIGDVIFNVYYRSTMTKKMLGLLVT